MMKYEDTKNWERARRLKGREEADKEHGSWWGGTDTFLNKGDLDHLINGGTLFFDDGEYSHALYYSEE